MNTRNQREEVRPPALPARSNTSTEYSLSWAHSLACATFSAHLGAHQCQVPHRVKTVRPTNAATRASRLPAIRPWLIDADDLDVEEQRLVDELWFWSTKSSARCPENVDGFGPTFACAGSDVG